MAMENLISLQSEGLRSIGEPTAPRPSGVQQGSVLVVVDVNKGVAPAAVYWALGNVVQKGDHLKILGIITHVPNPMGFMVRVDQSTRTSPNIMELQFEIATKEAIWRTAYLKEWCEKAGVKLEVDVKAGNNLKVIATDEAKAMGAYHVILDKNLKKDRKYFVDNLSCFVSRIRSGGGVDTLRSFSMSNMLPPMAPTTPKKTASNNIATESSHQSKASLGSTSSYRGSSSLSSTSFELGGESSDDFSTQEGDPVSIPSEDGPPPQLTIRINPPPPNQLYNLLRGSFLDGDNNNSNGFNLNNNNSGLNLNSIKNGFNLNSANNGLILNSNNNGLNLKSSNSGFNLSSNPLRKPAAHKWLNEEDQSHRISNIAEMNELPGPLTPRTEFRFEQGPVQRFRQGPANGWIGQLNVAPEFAGNMSMGRPGLTSTLHTQASFNNGRRRQHFRPDKISMDMHWPLMHWVDCRAFKLRSLHNSSSTLISSNGSLSNFRGRRRIPVSGLNYSDMVDSD